MLKVLTSSLQQDGCSCAGRVDIRVKNAKPCPRNVEAAVPGQARSLSSLVFCLQHWLKENAWGRVKELCSGSFPLSTHFNPHQDFLSWMWFLQI